MSRTLEVFPKVDILMIFLRIFEIFDFFIKNEDEFKGRKIIARGLALRVLPAETRLTVYRRLRVTRLRGPANWNSKKNVNPFVLLGVFFVEVMHSFIMVCMHPYFSYQVQ